MRKLRNFFLKIFSDRGFGLTELLVITSIISFISILTIKNFSSSRLNLERIANVIASDFRLAQQLAITSHQYQGPGDPSPRNRCGYGITKPSSGGQEDNATECSDKVDNDGDTFVDGLDPGCNRLYYIYAGPPSLKPDGSSNSCASKNYQASQDFPFYKSVVLDSRVDFVDNPGFRDIFYEPPGPTTYIQNQSTPSNLLDPTTYYERVTIKKVGLTKAQCNSGNPGCIFVCVYLSGRIEISQSPTCPAPF